MDIKKAGVMGFCSGVRRAIRIMERAAQEHHGISSLGTIVHNSQVVKRLSDSGVRVVDSVQEAADDTVAITSHGAGPGVYREAEGLGLWVVDTTCPFVKNAQRAAQKLAAEGFTVIIFGEGDHPEVQGVLAWAGEKAIATLDPGVFTGKALPRRVGLLSQTTQNPQHFAQFVAQFMAQVMPPLQELRVVNTICHATSQRQEAAHALAREVDLVLVVGGHNSANTRHLAKICADMGVETHHIQGAEEIQTSWLEGRCRTGVTAGASTPEEAVEAVVGRLKELCRKKA
ncbi:MAG: 4-hydroxy-3-methylbut-2-enyl diphosphate reductase [Chloroflexi bacterium]|nr:4-hydroxy-3-methylbut-2-enyl diphosphate reductase [Chloroflexota bacterium]